MRIEKFLDLWKDADPGIAKVEEARERLALFTYYSPSDQDGYIRPKAHYKVNDQWAIEAGANIFVGKEGLTFFGQFQDNSNAYAGVRLSF